MVARTRDERRHRNRLGWGVFLIALGLLFLLVQNGVLPDSALRTWWSFLVVGLGVMGIATARDPKALGSGVTLTGIGLWLSAAVNHWYGLDWGNSWPLSLVAVGLGTLAEWAATVVAGRREGQEDGHEG